MELVIKRKKLDLYNCFDDLIVIATSLFVQSVDKRQPLSQWSMQHLNNSERQDST